MKDLGGHGEDEGLVEPIPVALLSFIVVFVRRPEMVVFPGRVINRS